MRVVQRGIEPSQRDERDPRGETALAIGLSTARHQNITGKGLTADFGDYIFVQAMGNGSALTITPRKTRRASERQAQLPGDLKPRDTSAMGQSGIRCAGQVFLIDLPGTAWDSRVYMFGIPGAPIAWKQ